MSDNPVSPDPSDEMHAADVANGENTAEPSRHSDAEANDDAGTSKDQHRTGERQARENVANDPPA